MQFRVVAKSECQLAQSERQSTPKSSVYCKPNTARQPHTNTYNSYPQTWAVYNKVSRENSHRHRENLQASHRKDPARPICKMIQTFVIWRLMRPIKNIVKCSTFFSLTWSSLALTEKHIYKAVMSKGVIPE